MSENLDLDDACNATIDLGAEGIHLCALRPGHTEPHRHNAFFAAVKKAQRDEGDFQGIMEDRIHKDLGEARAAFAVRSKSMDDALMRVLLEAHKQSQAKGLARHAVTTTLPFEKQNGMIVCELVGVGFPLGQALKKILEGQLMLDSDSPASARAELLGAINYLAMAVLEIDRRATRP